MKCKYEPCLPFLTFCSKTTLHGGTHTHRITHPPHCAQYAKGLAGLTSHSNRTHHRARTHITHKQKKNQDGCRVTMLPARRSARQLFTIFEPFFASTPFYIFESKIRREEMMKQKGQNLPGCFRDCGSHFCVTPVSSNKELFNSVLDSTMTARVESWTGPSCEI